MDIPEEIAKEAEQAEREASAATAEDNEHPEYFRCVRCGENKGRIRMPSHMCPTCDLEALEPKKKAQDEPKIEPSPAAATSSDPNVLPSYPTWRANQMPMTTLDDLAQRLRMLMDSWTVQYEDGQLRIRFDTESRLQVEMAKLQATAALVKF